VLFLYLTLTRAQDDAAPPSLKDFVIDAQSLVIERIPQIDTESMQELERSVSQDTTLGLIRGMSIKKRHEVLKLHAACVLHRHRELTPDMMSTMRIDSTMECRCRFLRVSSIKCAKRCTVPRSSILAQEQYVSGGINPSQVIEYSLADLAFN